MGPSGVSVSMSLGVSAPVSAPSLSIPAAPTHSVCPLSVSLSPSLSAMLSLFVTFQLPILGSPGPPAVVSQGQTEVGTWTLLLRRPVSPGQAPGSTWPGPDRPRSRAGWRQGSEPGPLVLGLARPLQY